MTINYFLLTFDSDVTTQKQQNTEIFFVASRENLRRIKLQVGEQSRYSLESALYDLVSN